jgi:arsenate reductase (thioredoxin)
MRSPDEGRSRYGSRIVFVCEHGAALSVVAAAYFNKIAKKEHLNLHATARGTEPQKELAISAREGLNADGIPIATRRPQRLSDQDAAHARRIVAFLQLPAGYSTLAPVETWNDVPPTGSGYGPARDAILIHLRELIRQLRSEDIKP